MTSLAAPACPSPDRARRCSARARASRLTWSSSTSRTPSRPRRRRRRGTRWWPPSGSRTGARRSSASGSTTGRPSGPRTTSWPWSGRRGPTARRDHAAEGRVRGAGRGHGPPAGPGGAGGRAAGRPHRDRGPDRDHPRAHQRRGDLRGLAPARDHHLRTGRLRGVDGDAGAHGWRPDPELPGRPLPLRVLQDPHGRAGQRAAGHRRAVPLHPRQRRLPRLLPAHPHPGLRRQVGAPPGPGHDPERGLLADPGAVRPGLGHPRGLPGGHGGRGQGCGDVRRRDDRRGQPQDGDQVRVPRRAGGAQAVGAGDDRRRRRDRRVDAFLFDAGGVLVLPDPTVLGPTLAPYGGRSDARGPRSGPLRRHGAPRASRARRRRTGWPTTVPTSRPSAWPNPTLDGGGAGARARPAVRGCGATRSQSSVEALRACSTTVACPIGVVSNASGQIEAVLRRIEVCQVGAGDGVPVRCVVDSHFVGVAKPDPADLHPRARRAGPAAGAGRVRRGLGRRWTSGVPAPPGSGPS